MKKILTRYAFAFVMLISLTIGLNAQKYGHLNSTLLMSELPSVKTADAELQTYQNQLLKIGEDMVAKLQTNYEAYTKEANSGTLSQIQVQEKETLLAQEQQSIQAYQQEVQGKILAKRQELYDPIFENVRKIIEQYGKDNGYTMIFDSGLGAILFQDSEDLTDIIKAKL
jgi:outer membrane protein